MMGVPITFLDKYNPDQFEIVGNGDDIRANEDVWPEAVVDGVRMTSNTGQAATSAPNRSAPERTSTSASP